MEGFTNVPLAAGPTREMGSRFLVLRASWFKLDHRVSDSDCAMTATGARGAFAGGVGCLDTAGKSWPTVGGLSRWEQN